jgi:glycosyltransferase involved in cell wall biosynthesis
MKRHVADDSCAQQAAVSQVRDYPERPGDAAEDIAISSLPSAVSLARPRRTWTLKRQRRESCPRVLILVQNLPVPFDRRVWQEALALTPAGYEVHVVCPRTTDYPRQREIIDDIHIYRYSPGPEASRSVAYLREYSIAVLSQLRLALTIRARHRIDVVHICNPPDLLFLVALPLMALGARLIYDHHDACPEVMIAKGHHEGGRLVRLMTVLERLTYRAAHVSIETNDSFRDIAMRRGGMSPSDVFVVRSAPRDKRFAAARPDAKWRRGRKHLIGYVGIMGRQDGLDNLVDAAHLITRQWARDDVQFILVGDGPELARLRQKVTALGLDDHVEFTGLVSSDEVLGSILATTDVCVSPDEANPMNNISTMNKVLEYMALAKPIVQFDLREGRVSAGDSSLYAANNDVSALAEAMTRLLDDPDLRARMGDIGQQRLRDSLSWEMQVPNLLAAYERAMNKRNGQPAVDARPAAVPVPLTAGGEGFQHKEMRDRHAAMRGTQNSGAA